MRMYDLITKKKHGGELTDAEIHFMIDGYVSNAYGNLVQGHE